MVAETIYSSPEKKRKLFFRTSPEVDSKRVKINHLDEYTEQYEVICKKVNQFSDINYYYSSRVGHGMDNSLLIPSSMNELSKNLNRIVQELNQLLRHLIQENAKDFYSLIQKIRKTRKDVNENIDLLAAGSKDRGTAVNTLPADIQKLIFSFICPGTFGESSQRSTISLHCFHPSNGTMRRIFKVMTGRSTIDFLREVDLMRYLNLRGSKEVKMIDYFTPSRFTSPVIVLTNSRKALQAVKESSTVTADVISTSTVTAYVISTATDATGVVDVASTYDMVIS
jgi:hypothetical protein